MSFVLAGGRAYRLALRRIPGRVRRPFSDVVVERAHIAPPSFSSGIRHRYTSTTLDRDCRRALFITLMPHYAH